MAEWEITIEANTLNPHSDIGDLKVSTPTEFPDYALCIPGYSKLDGTFENAPDNVYGEIGYMSEYISDENGEFEEPPQITFEFARKKTSNGFNMIFNPLTGDYCTLLHIDWYKLDTVIYAADYEPTGVEFFCASSVGSFDKAVVTFYSTNKPYRYLWLAQCENTRLSDGQGLRIVYADVAYGGKDNTTITTNGALTGSTLSNLLLERGVNMPYYSIGFPAYSKLDGNYINAPDTITDIGYVSAQTSDASGDFDSTNLPTITFECSQVISSVGIQLTQNTASGDYCDHVRVTWYLNGTVLGSEEFYPDSVDYLCYKKVENYNTVVVEFLHTNNPYRPAFLSDFQYGTIRTFTDT